MVRTDCELLFSGEMLSPGEAETTLSHLDPSYLEVAAGRVGRGDAAQLHPQVSDQPRV